MKVTPEIVKDRLARFYIVFGMPSEGEAREFNRKVQIWTEHFQHVPASAFEMACFHCEGSLTSFPCIADVAGKIPS
ncbi:hypothetical protein BUE93_08635 [Chromobacterium amazonense]|uniref:Uncharacterized protein n=1 Tax=Chromobacterium amazonense TaxID=1382803 RepID=A0A2S9X5K4_9NEIS|nr:hypothetical protein [Chromobacterium amazonense]PRP71012.1 hypothetical protein BUE93_08635 [Chromobacterium amazonense]